MGGKQFRSFPFKGVKSKRTPDTPRWEVTTIDERPVRPDELHMSGHYQSQPPYLRVSLPLVSRLGLMQLSEPPLRASPLQSSEPELIPSPSLAW